MADNKITIRLTGRIDSQNAPEKERELLEILEKEAGSTLVIDASELSYISSAGLRILMKLRKTYGEGIQIREVSPEVYDIFDTTGFTELFDIRRTPREISLEGCEIIGKGFYGTVYRIDDDTIVKMYDSPDSVPMIENEKKMAKMAFLKGIPTAISFDIIRSGNRYGSVFEMLKSSTFNDLIIDSPDRVDEITDRYIAFMKEVHSTVMDPGTLSFARDRHIGYIDVISPFLDKQTLDGCRKLLMTLPDDLHVVHGDFQMKNVMLSGDEPMLIDMDTLSTGQPIFDLAGLYVTYRVFEEDEPGNTKAFLGIGSETAAHIWDRILSGYFDGANSAALSEISAKIFLVAYIRFMYIIAVSDLKNGETGKLRLKHSAQHLKELAAELTDLLI